MPDKRPGMPQKMATFDALASHQLVAPRSLDITRETEDDDNDQSRPLRQTVARSESEFRLSKLTISSSLHQIADSKFVNIQPKPLPEQPSGHNDDVMEHQHQQQQQLSHLTTATTTKTPSSSSSTASTVISTPIHDDEPSSPQKRLLAKKKDANLNSVHIVVGNEACDLDSAVSALIQFHIVNKIADELEGRNNSKTLYIPVMNTKRAVLESKSEVLWFIKKTLNIDQSFLTCKDDINWNDIKQNGIEILVTLVDHNYNEEFEKIGRIVEIIDHHSVQNPEWLLENRSNLILNLDPQVGSCTTLVAERLFYIYAEHHVSDEILLLIYGTVLLDTICLSEKAKRFTKRDVYLLKKIDASLGHKKPNREELYKQLVEVKNSTTGGLNFEQLASRDLKVFKDKNGAQVGIASLFGMAASEALGIAANVDLDAFFRKNNYEAFIMMGLVAKLDDSDGLSRDLVLISANRCLFDKLNAIFQNPEHKLDLEATSAASDPDPTDNKVNLRRYVTTSMEADGPPQVVTFVYRTKIWLQRNVTASRKVIAPLVLKVLHESAESGQTSQSSSQASN